MDVSQSKIKTWRQCRMQYHYKYILKLTRKHKPYPFMRGSILHNMLEAHYKGQDAWKPYREACKRYEKLFRIEREEYGDLPKDLKVLMDGYFAFYKKDELTPLEIEKEFRVKLVGNIFLCGKIDMIARAQKLKWMTEHKCHNTIPSGSLVPYTNLQSNSYVWAYEKETGKALDGICWNYLWGKPATKPKLLKNGVMSTRKTTLTWPMFRQALIDAKLEPTDYLKVKQELAGNEANFYQRKFIPIDKKLTENILEDTKATALEIEKLAGKDKTRNIGFHCDKCEYRKPCEAQLRGLDYNYILKADFIERKKKE